VSWEILIVLVDEVMTDAAARISYLVSIRRIYYALVVHVQFNYLSDFRRGDRKQPIKNIASILVL
jgi:hypothetical protein